MKKFEYKTLTIKKGAFSSSDKFESIIDYFSIIKDRGKMKTMMDMKKYAQEMVTLVSMKS